MRIGPFEGAANLSILFGELPLLERPQAAAEAGFTAAEMWWPFAGAVVEQREIDDLVGALDRAGLQLVGLNLFAGDMPAGERGVISWPDSVDTFRATLEVTVQIARRTGCRLFNALYGQRLEGLEPRIQDATAVQNLAYAAGAVGEIGGSLLIESLTEGENGAYPLLTAADAAGVIDRVQTQTAAGNLHLLFDTYHLARNGDDLLRVVETYADRIGHVQLADAPGRGQPGTGELDFAAVLHALESHGYRGAVACEYRPVGPTADSFGWIPGLDPRAR